MNAFILLRALTVGALMGWLPVTPTAAQSAPLSAADRLEIAEAVAGVGLYADLRDWARVERLLAPEVTTDYVSLFGGTVSTTEASALVAQWRSVLPGFDATQHLISNLSIQGDGDHAQVTSHVRATHWLGERSWTVGGVYTHRLIRREGGWRVDFIRLHRLYEEGDREILSLAADPPAAVDDD